MAQQTARPYTHKRRPTTSIHYNAAWIITAVSSRIRTQAVSRFASRGATPLAQCAWAFHTSEALAPEALAQVTAAVLIALSSVYKFAGICNFNSTIEPAETNANVDFAGRGGPLSARPSPPPPASSANTTAYFITAIVSTSTCSSTCCSSAAEPSAAPGTCRAGHEAFQNNTLSNCYIVYCTQDSSYPSYKIVPVQTGGFAQCFSACNDQMACVGWAYSGMDSGNCYLKSAMGNLYPSSSMIVSGFRPDNSTSSCNISFRPITSTANSSATPATPTRQRDCSQLAAFGTIYLDRNGNRYEIQCNTDYVGYNLVGPAAASYEDCFGICDKTPSCVAFSYLGGSGPGEYSLREELLGATITAWDWALAAYSRLIVTPFTHAAKRTNVEY